MKQDSPGRSLLVAFLVVFVCSLLVSGSVTLLRPIQAKQNAPQNYRHILRVAGLLKLNTGNMQSDDMVQLFQQVETNLLDLSTASFVTRSDEKTLELKNSSQDLDEISLTAEDDIAQLKTLPKLISVYWIHSSKTKAKLVLPVYGKGMWSMIHGYIALESDLNTIADMYFYEQGETPGIGELIQEDTWSFSWRGKQLYDISGKLALKVHKSTGETSQSVHQVDGITGATKTVDGVNNIVRFWFGDRGYRLFLAKQRKVLQG